MTIPFLDLSRLHRSIAAELASAYEDVVARSALVGAAASADFEREFAEAHGVLHAAGCGSGTDALALALRALGVGPGDEVVVPAMTFVATAEAVVHVGAVPVLADVDAHTLLLTDAGVEEVRTSRTKAVIPVHLYGHVVRLDVLDRWKSSGLVVVEDAAQAHLATWEGRTVGTAGHASCFSFYPGKNLGALGDGGAVLSNDADVMATVRSLRDHGSVAKYRHDLVGYCSRLDGVQAAWLRVKLRHLAAWTRQRQELAERYRSALPPGLLVDWEPGAVHHLLVARVPAGSRDQIAAALHGAGIDTGVHYPLAVSQQPAFEPYWRPCPNAEAAAAEVLSLPMDPLMTVEEVDVVAAALRDALTESALTR